MLIIDMHAKLMVLTASTENLAGVTVTKNVLGLVCSELNGPLVVAAVALSGVGRHCEKSW